MSRFIEPNGELWPNACIVYGSKALFETCNEACPTAFFDDLASRGVCDTIIDPSSYRLPPTGRNLLFVTYPQREMIVQCLRSMLAHRSRECNRGCRYQMAVFSVCEEWVVSLIYSEMKAHGVPSLQCDEIIENLVNVHKLTQEKHMATKRVKYERREALTEP